MHEYTKFLIANLDGYLNGVVSLNGKIGDYSACSFLIERKKEKKNKEINISIRDYLFNGDYHDSFVFEKFEKSIYQLEVEICPYLIKNILDCDLLFADHEGMKNKMKYLSFRIIDIIEDIIGLDIKNPHVFKLEGVLKDLRLKRTFFVIDLKESFLILQFDDHTLNL